MINSVVSATQAARPTLELVGGEHSNSVPKRKVLLIVDDNDSVRHALRRELEVDNYQVIEAGDGPQALYHMEQQHIDMVLSDQRMPLMCGFRLLEKVREHNPDCLRLLISGYTDFSALVAAINDASISAFINKPWDSIELRELIRQKFAQQAATTLATHPSTNPAPDLNGQ